MKDEIINFDSRNITPEIHDSVSELLAQKANSFEHNTIYRVSVAAAPLAAWVKANLEYAVVLKKVGPMMQENGETRRHRHRRHYHHHHRIPTPHRHLTSTTSLSSSS